VNHGSNPRLQTPRVNLGVFLFATGFETGFATRFETPFKPRLQQGFKRLLEPKGPSFCNEVATVVRDDVENKVANEGCKPEWNERLHMLERRLQRYKFKAE
jgi:hypothetical protein